VGEFSLKVSNLNLKSYTVVTSMIKILESMSSDRVGCPATEWVDSILNQKYRTRVVEFNGFRFSIWLWFLKKLKFHDIIYDCWILFSKPPIMIIQIRYKRKMLLSGRKEYLNGP
jgi:hypothetical protein